MPASGFKGPNFAQPCGAHRQEACSDLKGKPIKEMAQRLGCGGLALEVPRPGEIHPTPRLTHTPFLPNPWCSEQEGRG